MRLYFDAGVWTHKKQGVWAVILVDDMDQEYLIGAGLLVTTSSSDAEFIAANEAARLAAEYKVTEIRGDFRPAVNKMAEDHPEFSWEWVPSRSNLADRYAAIYPSLGYPDGV